MRLYLYRTDQLTHYINQIKPMARKKESPQFAGFPVQRNYRFDSRAERISAAIFPVGAVGLAVAVVVDAIITDLGIASATAVTRAGWILTATLLVSAVDLVIAVVIDTGITDLGATAGVALRRAAALAVIAVGIIIAAVINGIIADFGRARIDAGVVIIAVNCATTAAFFREAVTVIVRAGRAGAEIGRVRT